MEMILKECREPGPSPETKLRLFSSIGHYHVEFLGFDSGTVAICETCKDMIYSDEERAQLWLKRPVTLCRDCFKRLQALFWERYREIFGENGRPTAVIEW